MLWKHSAYKNTFIIQHKLYIGLSSLFKYRCEIFQIEPAILIEESLKPDLSISTSSVFIKFVLWNLFNATKFEESFVILKEIFYLTQSLYIWNSEERKKAPENVCIKFSITIYNLCF